MTDPNQILAIATQACDAFRRQVGKQATLLVCPAEKPGTPPTLAFRPKAGRKDRIYAIVLIPAMDVAALALLIKNKKTNAGNLVLTYHANPAQARRMKDDGIPFLDTAGNAYLFAPGFFLFIAGCAPQPDRMTPTPARAQRLLNAKGLKVLFVLLARPEYLARPYRDVAHAAGVALGTVAGVIANLKDLGYLIDLGKQGKHLQQRAKLIDEWTGAYARTLIPRHVLRRFRAENPDWWRPSVWADSRPCCWPTATGRWRPA